MTDFYQKMQDIASNLLTRYNQGTIEYGLITPGNGPAHNPGPGTPTWTLLKATASATYSVSGGSKRFAPNTLIQEGDLKVTSKVMAGLNPKPGDQVRFGGAGGQSWRIIQFNAVPASGTPAAWVFYVRRGGA